MKVVCKVCSSLWFSHGCSGVELESRLDLTVNSKTCCMEGKLSSPNRTPSKARMYIERLWETKNERLKNEKKVKDNMLACVLSKCICHVWEQILFQYAARHNPIAISDLVNAIEATDGDGDVGMGGGDGSTMRGRNER